MINLTQFKQVLEKLYQYKTTAQNRKVRNEQSTSELLQQMNLSISQGGTSFEELNQFLDQYLEYSTNTHSNQFLNQFFTGGNLPAILGEVITAFTNTSMYTFEVAPVATLIEKKMIAKMCQVLGYENGDGIFTTGGSNANMIAMLSARNHKVQYSMYDGITQTQKLTAFISDQMHYSFQTAANILGIGIDNLIKVKSDSKGKIILSELELAIQESKQRGEIPFIVCGIAGTTVLGAFDDFEGIATIAQKHQLWFHIDGAFGGSLLLSEQKHQLFKGAELADSFAWDAHKLMNIPFVCSVILMKNRGLLSSNLSNLNKEYLFHNPNEEDLDLGLKSLQCGRKADALKLFIAWKYYGDQQLFDMTNNLLDIAQYFTQKVKSYPELELFLEPETLCVCFRVKHHAPDKFNVAIRNQILKKGKSMVNYTRINNQIYFRFVNVNMACTKADIDQFFVHFFEAHQQVLQNS